MKWNRHRCKVIKRRVTGRNTNDQWDGKNLLCVPKEIPRSKRMATKRLNDKWNRNIASSPFSLPFFPFFTIIFISYRIIFLREEGEGALLVRDNTWLNSSREFFIIFLRRRSNRELESENHEHDISFKFPIQKFNFVTFYTIFNWWQFIDVKK